MTSPRASGADVGFEQSALDRVIDFVLGSHWESLPSAVQQKVHLCLIDDVGALLVGARTPVGHIIADYVGSDWPGDQATVFATWKRSSPAGAALANGFAANATDIDDCGIYTWGHPGALLLASTLAVSESAGASGEDLLTALTVGYEVAFRTARCFHDHDSHYRACASWGSVACAAVSARIMGLGRNETAHALGIAEFFSPDAPVMTSVAWPSMSKHAMGWGAMTGVMAAQFAARGFTGVPSLLGLPKYGPWIEDIGEEYLLPHGITWKEFSCCAWAHPAILAVRQLMSDQPFGADDVQAISVETFSEACSLGGGVPSSSEEAQFSVAWPVAAFVVDGEVGSAQVTTRLADPLIRDIAARITVIERPDFTRLAHLAEQNRGEGATCAVVTVDLRNGKRLISDVANHVLYPESPWSFTEVAAKFRALAGDVLGPETAERCLRLLADFAAVERVAELIETLEPGCRRGEDAAAGLGSLSIHAGVDQEGG